MAILPEAESTVSNPPDFVTAQRMARVDGCGVCVANYVLPSIVHDAPEGGFVAHYTCTDCGHDWITSWGDR